MRFAFKTSPQNGARADVPAVWRPADDIQGYESIRPTFPAFT
jgi:hypothetical protein